MIDAHRQELTVDRPRDPVYVNADPVRLAQVFSNLVNNAAKFMDAGGQIRFSAGRQGNEAVISIKDGGVGLAAGMLPHIFEIFWQASPALERSHGGLGVGLSLARGIVELHGGRIEARSQGLGHGSEFIVYLPVASDPAQTPAARPDELLQGGKVRRVLIVDDVKDNADSLAELLKTSDTTCTRSTVGRRPSQLRTGCARTQYCSTSACPISMACRYARICDGSRGASRY